MSTTEPAGNSPAPTTTFTAFCQDADGTGTIWIEAIQATSLEAAIGVAEAECAAAWGYKVDEVRCLGIAAGDVTILYWNGEEG